MPHFRESGQKNTIDHTLSSKMGDTLPYYLRDLSIGLQKKAYRYLFLFEPRLLKLSLIATMNGRRWENLIHGKSRWKENCFWGRVSLSYKLPQMLAAWLNWFQKRETKTTVKSLVKWRLEYFFALRSTLIAIRGEIGKKNICKAFLV